MMRDAAAGRGVAAMRALRMLDLKNLELGRQTLI